MGRDNLQHEFASRRLRHATRRHFLKDCATGLGAMWFAMQSQRPAAASGAPAGFLAPPARAKRVIYLHMVGAPSQLELFDFKPELKRVDGELCPESFLEGKRFAFLQGRPRMLGPIYPFKQHGESGAWFSDRLPHMARCADDFCVVKTLQTDQFNHGPAQLMVHAGQPRMGYPAIGSWVTWGLGTDNADLPGFIVLLSGGRQPRVGKALWSSGFLPSVYQGVQCRGEGDPVLNIANPDGVTRADRRALIDTLDALNEQTYEEFGDPETLTRTEQYELAFRMQAAAPDAMDISREPAEVLGRYGAQPGGESFANNCLLARRLVERGVRFVQLFDWGWDSHGSNASEALDDGFRAKCRQVDRPTAALVEDLRERGLLEDTLVVWGGEFGRTPMQENRGGVTSPYYGRDHNPNAFTVLMAGGGVRGGYTHGETDAMGYDVVRDPVPLRDFHATMLRLLGVDHERMTFPFQGLDQKLTGVKPARVVEQLLA
ncbi:DUF1501 domain-containing protein [Botrimarina sp.]|uniref:DUF1501 domain-containing protein n=1 Tax=Botrimarina sp. TaxID=2795802 RepID=UPI0032EAF5DC